MSNELDPKSESTKKKSRSSSHRRSSSSRPHYRHQSKILTSVIALLTLPYRKLRAQWKHWAPDRKLNQQLGGAAHLFNRVMQFEGTDYKLEREDGKILVRAWPSKKTMLNPIWWITSCFSFLLRWLTSRPYLPMLLALPALFVAVALLGAISAGNSISDGTHGMLYRRLLAEAANANDLVASRLAIDALRQLNPNNASLLYDSALIEERAGNVPTAQKIMVELATSVNSEPAALWMAQSVVKSILSESAENTNFSNWTPQQAYSYYQWLTIAAKNAPNDPLPKRMIGDLFRLRGDKQRAYDALLPIADGDTQTSYIVCFLQKELGLKELSKSRSQRLIRTFMERLQETPKDVEARTQCALLLAINEREPEGMQLLGDGLVLATLADDRARLESTQAEILVMESQRIADSDKSPRGLLERFRKLIDAVAIDPQNPSLIDAITQACIAAADSENNEMLVLREALVQNIDADTAHFILGTVALNRGDMTEATQHLELAAKNNEKLPGLLNNLAHAICHGPNPDLRRALRMSDAALALLDHPYLHETRGQIHLKLKNYTEAIADLEVALNAPELAPLVRESLAQAYEASGQTEIAQRQRELLKANR